MKKLMIIIPLIILISGCIVIEERYRTPGPRVRTVESYDYYPYYYDYYDVFWYPSFYWMGLSWWNPFWYYSFYNYYYGWYYPYYGMYYHYYPSRYVSGRSVVTKDQLQSPRTAADSGRKILYVDRKAVSSLSKGSRRISSTKSTSTSRVSRVSSSRVRSVRSTGSSSVSRTSSRSSSRSTGKKKK